MYTSYELDEVECEELLRAGLVARAAVSTPTGPHIVPVNYAVVDRSIVFRTTPDSFLGAHARGSRFALEIDEFDYERQRGWSVVARGRAEVLEDASELEHVRQTWEPHTWAAGSRSLYVRIRWTELSGRRLGADWDPLDGLPVRRVV